jgi:hypothetical protein
VQKANPVRLRLQVETLHTQYFDFRAMGFLQALQRRHDWSLKDSPPRPESNPWLSGSAVPGPSLIGSAAQVFF